MTTDLVKLFDWLTEPYQAKRRKELIGEMKKSKKRIAITKYKQRQKKTKKSFKKQYKRYKKGKKNRRKK